MNAPKFANPACADATDLFFASETPANLDKAKAICLTCPHLWPCAEWAINNERIGVWGATSPDLRRQIRAERGLPPLKFQPVEPPRPRRHLRSVDTSTSAEKARAKRARLKAELDAVRAARALAGT